MKGIFKKTKMSGASMTTPGSDQLHREFKVKGTKECLLRSKVVTWRSPGYKGDSSRFKLREIHERSSFK